MYTAPPPALLPGDDANGFFSTYGGLLMFFTGVLYLLFENAIIGQLSSKDSKDSGPINSVGSRVIMGTQVSSPHLETLDGGTN